MTVKDTFGKIKRFLSNDVLKGIFAASLLWGCVFFYQSSSHESEIKDFKRKAHLALSQKDLQLEKQTKEYNESWVEMNELLYEQRKLIEKMGETLINYKYTIQELLRRLQGKPAPKQGEIT